MDLLATILTCSLYASDDAVVRAIAEGPSDKNPYFLVNTAAPAEGAALPPTTEKEALARSRELIAQGGRPLLGLLEVPPSWLSAFGQPLASAFDPCTNVAIGTAMLSEFDAECASKVASRTERARMLERTNRRVCVLRKYEAAIDVADFADAILLELSVQQPASASIEDAPIFVPASARVWGPDRVLVRLPVALAPPAPRPAVLRP
ncbi:MAG: hypothetical protein ACRENE_03855 [Polyangiaceae bacterium]